MKLLLLLLLPLFSFAQVTVLEDGRPPTAATGGNGDNPFDQDLNSNNEVSFATVAASTFSSAEDLNLLAGTYGSGVVRVQSNIEHDEGGSMGMASGIYLDARGTGDATITNTGNGDFTVGGLLLLQSLEGDVGISASGTASMDASQGNLSYGRATVSPADATFGYLTESDVGSVNLVATTNSFRLVVNAVEVFDMDATSAEVSVPVDLPERGSDPAAPPANTARFYSRDNGAGKTQLVVRFPTGAIQVLATEP
jgi:hypothetical protein